MNLTLKFHDVPIYIYTMDSIIHSDIRTIGHESIVSLLIANTYILIVENCCQAPSMNNPLTTLWFLIKALYLKKLIVMMQKT